MTATSREISDLIVRLQAATGPDRVLDAEIFRAIGLTAEQERHCKQWCRMDGRTDLTREHYIAAWAPEFTRSLDAALTLIPEGWALCRINQYHEDQNPAWGWSAQLRCWKNPGAGHAGAETRVSLAFAICLACLLARLP